MTRRALRAVALAGAALAIGVYSSGKRGQELDRELFAAINRGHGPGPDRLWAGVTELGSLYASAAAATAIALSGRRREAVRALGAAVAMWLLGQGAKQLFRRPRPADSNPDGARQLIAMPQGASWPSSHPAVLTAFTVVAARELRVPPSARVALGGLGAAVGFSRTYLGVHYPSDVVGGLLLGRAIGHLWRRRLANPSR